VHLQFSSACAGANRRTFLRKNEERGKSPFSGEKCVICSAGNEIIGAQHDTSDGSPAPKSDAKLMCPTASCRARITGGFARSLGVIHSQTKGVEMVYDKKSARQNRKSERTLM
jgi:hypothetical protein